MVTCGICATIWQIEIVIFFVALNSASAEAVNFAGSKCAKFRPRTEKFSGSRWVGAEITTDGFVGNRGNNGAISINSATENLKIWLLGKCDAGGSGNVILIIATIHCGATGVIFDSVFG